MFCLILLVVPACFNILDIILAHNNLKVFKCSSIPGNPKNFSFKGTVKFFLTAYYQQICNPHDGNWKVISLIIKTYGNIFVYSFLSQDLKEMFCYLSCFKVSVGTQDVNFYDVPFQTHHHQQGQSGYL